MEDLIVLQEIEKDNIEVIQKYLEDGDPNEEFDSVLLFYIKPLDLRQRNVCNYY